MRQTRLALGVSPHDDTPMLFAWTDFPHHHRMRLRVRQGGDGTQILSGFVIGGNRESIDFPTRLVLKPAPEHRRVMISDVLEIVEDLGPALFPPKESRITVVEFSDHHHTPLARSPRWLTHLKREGLLTTAEHHHSRAPAPGRTAPAQADASQHATPPAAKGLGDLYRWQKEMHRPGAARSTLIFGAVAEAARIIDDAVASTIDRVVASGEKRALSVIDRVAEGKALNKLTLGERLHILRGLDKRYLVIEHEHVIDRPLRDVMDRLEAMRKRVAHAGAGPPPKPNELTLFIDDAITLMNSRLLTIPQSSK